MSIVEMQRMIAALAERVRELERSVPNVPIRQPIANVRFLAIVVAEIVEVFGDYVTAKVIDETGVGQGDEIKVAKPYLLRKSTLDGKTIGNVRFFNYDSSGVLRAVETVQSQISYSQSERIDPPYIIDGIKNYVTAAKLEHTGVLVDGEEVEYVDLNTEPREWRASY